jgi:hypothetical protein
MKYSSGQEGSAGKIFTIKRMGYVHLQEITMVPPSV